MENGKIISVRSFFLRLTVAVVFGSDATRLDLEAIHAKAREGMEKKNEATRVEATT